MREVLPHAVEVRRGGTWERFQDLNLIGSWADHDFDAPEVGVWGVRVYTDIKDARTGKGNDPFPHTHFWASEGAPAYEHLKWSDGRERESGEGDTLGITFAVRGVEGPEDYELSDDVAWAFRGDWDDANY